MLPTFTGGCGSESDELANARKTAASWATTLELTADQWSENRVPAIYVRQLCDAADKALVKQSQAIASILSGDSQRLAIDARIAQLRRLADQLRQAAERDDQAGAVVARHLIAEDQGGSPTDGGRRP